MSKGQPAFAFLRFVFIFNLTLYFLIENAKEKWVCWQGRKLFTLWLWDAVVSKLSHLLDGSSELQVSFAQSFPGD